MAFLHGDLEETIYMRQPLGFKEGTCNKVCLLKKSLYGLSSLQGTGTKDDMLISCKSKSEIEYTKRLLRKEFDMKEPGPARKILVGLCAMGAHFKVSLKDFPLSDWDVERMSKVPYANVVGLVYGRDQRKHVDVDGFVDTNYAKDPNKGRSITG
ncbi:retrotransposon protein, putative, ty1-copia subclass [Tanacetum coccineum]